MGACGGAILLLPQSAHAVFLVAAAIFIYSLGETAFGVNMQTCHQEVTPTRLMGRMDTTMRLCFRGMASIGALSGGFIGLRFGLQAAIAVGVVGLLVAVVGLYTSGLRGLVNALETQATA